METILLQLVIENLDMIISFLIGIIVMLVFNKTLTGSQREKVNEITQDIRDLISKVKNLIVSVESEPIKKNEQLSEPVTSLTPMIIYPEKEFRGLDKENIVLNTINEKFTDKEKSSMITSAGSIVSFIRLVYPIAKPFLKMIRLSKRGK